MEQLDHSIILIKPSKRLQDFINKLKTTSDMPKGIVDVRSKNKLNTSERKVTQHKLLINKNDINFIKSLNLSQGEGLYLQPKELSKTSVNDRLLNLEDLHWLHAKIVACNKDSGNKVYLHEIFEGSEILVPKNKEIVRNPELEIRCQKLKAQQDNRMYQAMTKNVDNVRHNHPEDTIAYQMKQINTHLIAIAQFIISVLAGFTFGFLGVELMIGKLDFGFRLLLGIICALVIALAELYFLAKKLNEDLEIEFQSNKIVQKKKTKVD